MANIKAQYNIDNGVDFDTYHFETSEEMLVGQQQVLNNTGYRKLPGGLILAWGEVETTFNPGVTSSFNLELPIPMTNKILYADAKCCYNVTEKSQNYIAYFTSAYADTGNLSSAKFYYRSENNSVPGHKFRFKVFVLGY